MLHTFFVHFVDVDPFCAETTLELEEWSITTSVLLIAIFLMHDLRVRDIA